MEPNYKPVYSEAFCVRSFDIGLNARMRLSNVCSYFQEIAGRHANHLDAGYRVMHENKRVWVLSKLFMDIKGLPLWNQDFEAYTWPLGTERIFFRRDYRLTWNNETLITAASYWILLDLQSRRPGTFSLNEDVLRHNKGMYAMEMPSEILIKSTGEIVSEETLIHDVVYSDIDQNGHVNNARYVVWIMDCFKPEFHKQCVPSWFAIEYRHEVKPGDKVELKVQELEADNPAFNIEGKIAGTGQVCIRSGIRFSKNIT